MTEKLSLGILAVVTKDLSIVKGGAPIFFARDDDELNSISKALSNILDASVHDLGNNTYILVRH